MLRILFAIVLLGASRGVLASDPLIVELHGRLKTARVGEDNVYLAADAPNAYLSANWETKMARFAGLVRRCEYDALELGVKLLNTTNLEALGGLIYSLELAMGKCPEKLLALVPSEHIKSLCAVDAYAEEHRKTKLTAEIGRRVARLRQAGPIAASPNWSACIDAYEATKQALHRKVGRVDQGHISLVLAVLSSAQAYGRVGPNPSLKPSPNGGPPGPRGSKVYLPPRGPGVPPSVPS